MAVETEGRSRAPDSPRESDGDKTRVCPGVGKHETTGGNVIPSLDHKPEGPWQGVERPKNAGRAAARSHEFY